MGRPTQQAGAPAPLLILLLSFLALTACARAAPTPPAPPTLTPAATLIRVTGSYTMEPLLAELARAYSRERADLIIEVTGGGSQAAIEAVKAGRAEIGMVARPLAEDERTVAGGAPLRDTLLARDGLALIVHPSNPINRIGRAQVMSLFRGDTFRWDDLGWLAGTVDLVSREAGSGDRAVIAAFALPDGAPLSPNARLLPNPSAVVRHVAETPAAIGYVSLAQLSGVVKALRLDDVAPTREAVADGSYPLTRELLLVTRGEPTGETRRFLDWLQTPEAQAIVARRFALP